MLAHPFVRSSVVPLGLGVLLGIYTWGVLRQAFIVNRDHSMTDQGAYISISQEMERSDLTYVSPRVRTPLYMVLGSTVIKDSMPVEQAFALGKILNIALSFVVLGGILALYRSVIDPIFGGALAAIAAFTVVGYRAGYFQCEMLYGFLFLLFFALTFEMFRRPRVLTAVAAGAVAVVGHLTKASLILGIYIAIGYATLVLVYKLLPFPWRSAAARAESWRPAVRQWVMPLIMFAVFFVLGSPYFLKSKELYGSFFYNANTAHNIWYDSWRDVKEKTGCVTDHTTLRTMKDYLAEKSPQQIAERMGVGFAVFWHSFFVKYSIGIALVVLSFGAVTLAATGRGRCTRDLGAVLARFARSEHIFAAALFAIYLLAYIFHAQILPFPRFFIALALPAYFWVGLCAKELLGDRCAAGMDEARRSAAGWLWMTVLAAAFLIYELRFRWMPLTGREYFGQ